MRSIDMDMGVEGLHDQPEPTPYFETISEAAAKVKVIGMDPAASGLDDQAKPELARFSTCSATM